MSNACCTEMQHDERKEKTLKSGKRVALFLLAGAGFFITAAHGDDDERSYLAVGFNHAQMDDARGIDGDGMGATFLYGTHLAGNWFLETRLTGLVLERGDAGGTDFYQQDLGADAVYRFGSGTGWEPFALLGVSAIRNDVEEEELDEVNAGIHAGLGVVSAPLGSMDLRFRIDARYVNDDYLDGLQDVRIGIGIEIPLGGRPVSTARREESPVAASGDRDGDGVSDDRDACSNSLPYVRHDTSGCMLPDQTIRMYEVTFNNGTSILTAAAREELNPLVLALRDQPNIRVRIDGHTDSLGGAEDNRRLSQERAEAVATHLALQGVPTQRITTRGFGESRPVASNSTAAGREKNRRIEVVLLAQPQH